MKYLATFLGTIVLFMSTTNVNFGDANKNDDVRINNVVFDGNEGNLYFFTDADDKAITIEDNEDVLFKDFALAPNNYVGKTFEIVIDKKEIKNNVCNSKSVITIKLKSIE